MTESGKAGLDRGRDRFRGLEVGLEWSNKRTDRTVAAHEQDKQPVIKAAFAWVISSHYIRDVVDRWTNGLQNSIVYVFT